MKEIADVLDTANGARAEQDEIDWEAAWKAVSSVASRDAERLEELSREMKQLRRTITQLSGWLVGGCASTA